MIESGPSCGNEAIANAGVALGVTMPDGVRRLFARGDGRYDSEGEWWVLWPLARVVEDTRRAWADGTLDGQLLAIGDDGTGNPFCVPVDGRDEVVRWNYIDGCVEVHEGSIDEFAAVWLGGSSGS